MDGSPQCDVVSGLSDCLLFDCSIDQMSEVVRFAIESGIKLKEELVLEQEDFLVTPVRHVQSPALSCGQIACFLIYS